MIYIRCLSCKQDIVVREEMHDAKGKLLDESIEITCGYCGTEYYTEKVSDLYFNVLYAKDKRRRK